MIRSEGDRNYFSNGRLAAIHADPDAAEFAGVRHVGTKTETAEKPVAFGLLAGGDRHRPRHGARYQLGYCLVVVPGHRHADDDERAGLENQPQSKMRSVLNLSEISSGPLARTTHMS
jgi:hypothetical protein